MRRNEEEMPSFIGIELLYLNAQIDGQEHFSATIQNPYLKPSKLSPTYTTSPINFFKKFSPLTDALRKTPTQEWLVKMKNNKRLN